MVFGLLFTMAGISSVLASWIVLFYAIFKIEPSVAIVHFLVFIILSV
jgi:hypothetical protein